MTHEEEVDEIYLKKAAQAWCYPETEKIEMDSRLAFAFAKILAGAYREYSELKIMHKSVRDHCESEIRKLENTNNNWYIENARLREKVKELEGCQKEREAALERVKELSKQVCILESVKMPRDTFTYCGYCGEKFPLDDESLDLSAHIKVCPDHPMRGLEAAYREQVDINKAKTQLIVNNNLKATAEISLLNEKVNILEHTLSLKSAHVCSDPFMRKRAEKAEDAAIRSEKK